jgi:hypothetical protein
LSDQKVIVELWGHVTATSVELPCWLTEEAARDAAKNRDNLKDGRITGITRFRLVEVKEP